MSIEYVRHDINRPSDSSFHQQRIKGWQPVITTKNLFIPFTIIGLVFIIFGSVFIYYTYQIEEHVIDYTNCKNDRGELCSKVLLESNLTYQYLSCQCLMNITLDKQIDGPVNVYYGLNNFYQNHRVYVRSRDDKQLHGDNNINLNEDCKPYQYYNETSRIGYAPCGLVANSLFNDSFIMQYLASETNSVLVPWTYKGIAWPSEVHLRYGKPSSWSKTVKPVNWPQTALERNLNAYSEDEELIVWMRTAAFPQFRKMHRIILLKPNTEFDKGLPKGQYQLMINYSYPVTQYGGSKQFIITSTNRMGGKNLTAGFILVALGAIYIALAVTFVFINMYVARRQHNDTCLLDPHIAVSENLGENYGADFLDGFTDNLTTEQGDVFPYHINNNHENPQMEPTTSSGFATHIRRPPSSHRRLQKPPRSSYYSDNI